MNILILNNSERILSFLDPNLLDITETFENGLRSIDVKYNIDEILDANEWFKTGNKIYITAGGNLTECLYVLNTEVKQDLFNENQFTFKAEEVLVELNYAPFFTQAELGNKAFTVSKKQGEIAIKVDYNSLNEWFGKYFNLGIIQDCISDYASKITFTGSMPLMQLLRYIEEETGNVFVTRYEKDVLDNTIHRYLDFLNPISQNKNWSTYFEYDFIPAPEGAFIIDDEGNPVEDTEEDLDDDQHLPNYPLITNINPENIQFRITKEGQILKTENNIQLLWNAEDIGLTSQSTNVAIQIRYYQNKVGIKIHNKSFVYPAEDEIGGQAHSYIQTIADDPTYIDDTILLPNNSIFEFYDTNSGKVIYHRTLNPILSEAREDILDLAYNVDNIQFSTDESDTFTAISPILKLSDSGSGTNSLSSTDMGKIVDRWLKLQVNKGDIIPMFVEKVTVTGTDSKPCSQRTGTARAPNQSAEQILGTNVLSSNYYSRPLKPNDNTEGDNKSFEYWKGTAYWNAPFTKKKNSFHIEVDRNDSVDYDYIRPRSDLRTSRGPGETPKMGQVETSDEDIYNIYNAVAMKLKEKKDPKFDITVEVANYRDGLYNDYNIHDKVYVKLPNTEGLVVAKVVKTVKSLHDISENKITLDNYSTITKEITTDTYIESANISFKYPASKQLKVTLKNTADDNDKLSNKLLTFRLYNIENGSSTFTGKVYTKKTDKNGECTITCKYDPGDYEMQIQFGGDVEYTETSTSVLINVTGVKKEKTTNTNKNTTAKKYKNVKRYWSKTGVSPDGKYIKAVGRASAAGEVDQYGYGFHETEFENYCPKCHKKGTLVWGIWWAGKNTDYGYFPALGHKEGSSIEGAVFCSNGKCDGDWSIYGKEHGYTNTRLKVHKSPKQSSESQANMLRNGKLYYDTQKVLIKPKNVTNKRKRVRKGNLSKTIINLAESIVGGSWGHSAMLKVCTWMDNNIKYTHYFNFCRSPETVLSKKHGNCCDQTRLLLQLLDAAGLTEWYDLCYVKVDGHVYAQVKNRSNGNKVYLDPASDSHGCYGYVCQGYAHGSASSTYPNQPFYGC